MNKKEQRLAVKILFTGTVDVIPLQLKKMVYSENRVLVDPGMSNLEHISGEHSVSTLSTL